MDRYGPDRVVHANRIDPRDTVDAEHARDRSDPERRARAHRSARRRDRDQAGEGTIQREEQVRLIVANPAGDHRRDRADGRGERRVDGDPCHDAGLPHSEGRTGVEPVPAEPEDEYAERGQRQAVPRDGIGRTVRVELAEARSEHPRGDKPGHPAYRVHHSRPGEVVEAKAGEPTAAPHPVPDDRVDERRKDKRVGQVGCELHSLRDGTRDDRRRRSGEHGLEEPEYLHRKPLDGRLDPREEPSLGPEEKPLGAIHDRVPEDEVPERGGREIEEILHQHQAGFQYAEASLHEEHQDRRDEDPERAHRVVGGRILDERWSDQNECRSEVTERMA